MIINPYAIKNESIKEEILDDRENVIEEVIKFLSDEHKGLVDMGKSEDTKRIIQNFIISKKFKFNNYQIEQIVKDVTNKIFGYGIFQDYITDEITTDIRAVGYNKIYVKQRGKWLKSNLSFESDN